MFPAPKDLSEARHIQQTLAAQVNLTGDLGGVHTLAALDASMVQDGPIVAAAVLWDLAAQEVKEVGLAAVAQEEVFPYVSGFLSFREAPAYLAALAALSRPPDLLLVDGQGIAHPRGLGIAAHLGVHLDLPSIGVAKSRLYGRAAGELAEEAGGAVALEAKGRQVGWVYRSRTGVKPLYLSPGHKVAMQRVLTFVRDLPGKTKLPEPLRQAHNWAGRARKEGLRGNISLSNQGEQRLF